MVNENIIPKTETVYELKEEYKIPSFEEFMKDYKVDENLNYDDLNSWNVGEAKGYGPCSYSSCPYSTSFKLNVEAINEGIFTNDGGEQYSENLVDVEDARRAVRNIMAAQGNWKDEKTFGFLPNRWLNSKIRVKLANMINEAIRHHKNGGNVDGWIVVRETGVKWDLISSSSY